MSLYDGFLLLHVIAAIIWLGAGLVLTMLVLRADLLGDPAAKAEVNAGAEWLATRLFIPAAFATLLFGVLAMVEGPWGLDQLWVAIGLVGWAVSFGTGILYFKPEGERIEALVGEHGPENPEVQARLDRLELVSRVELTVLYLVAADMVVKPTGEDTGILIAGALVLAAVAAMLVSRARRRPALA